MTGPHAQVSDADAIRLDDVRFQWGGRYAFGLTISQFHVARGEKVFLFGESGSGKSTLLSLICGVSRPESGAIEVDGVVLSNVSGSALDRFRAEHIGVIFQMFNLLSYASPLDNILLPLAFASERRMRAGPDMRAEALRLSSHLGLPERLVTQSSARELSVGQQQRVAVARALIGAPPLIIADEPTSSLDANAQGAFLDLLFEQVEAAGVTLLMVSHDLRLAQRFTRTIALQDIAETRTEAP